MLGSWYTPREIGKRAMVFWLAGSIGQMFSGFLQAAAVSSSVQLSHLFRTLARSYLPLLGIVHGKCEGLWLKQRNTGRGVLFQCCFRRDNV